MEPANCRLYFLGYLSLVLYFSVVKVGDSWTMGHEGDARASGG